MVDRTTTDFTADTQRYDLVFDAVGKCSFRQCKELLKPGGIWTSTDLGLSQNPLLALATRFSRGRRVLFPIPRIDREMVEYLKGLVESRQFTPVVDARTRSSRSSRRTGTWRHSRRSATW